MSWWLSILHSAVGQWLAPLPSTQLRSLQTGEEHVWWLRQLSSALHSSEKMIIYNCIHRTFNNWLSMQGTRAKSEHAVMRRKIKTTRDCRTQTQKPKPGSRNQTENPGFKSKPENGFQVHKKGAKLYSMPNLLYRTWYFIIKGPCGQMLTRPLNLTSNQPCLSHHSVLVFPSSLFALSNVYSSSINWISWVPPL